MQGLSDAEKKGLGKDGEGLAAAYLRNLGYRILERNYRCRLGEVDLIIEKKGEILFVEVKTRRSIDAVNPRELIPYGKQVHISKVAQHYVAAKRLYDVSADFAVLIVDFSEGAPRFEFIEGAFPLVWGY